MAPSYVPGPGSSSAGPSKPSPTQRPNPPPPAGASPVPQPIRRAVAPRPGPTPSPSPVTPNARSKSLWGSYLSLTANTRIVFGLCLAGVAVGGLWWDRKVGGEEDKDAKPVVAVRMVDRER